MVSYLSKYCCIVQYLATYLQANRPTWDLSYYCSMSVLPEARIHTVDSSFERPRDRGKTVSKGPQVSVHHVRTFFSFGTVDATVFCWRNATYILLEKGLIAKRKQGHARYRPGRENAVKTETGKRVIFRSDRDLPSVPVLGFRSNIVSIAPPRGRVSCSRPECLPSPCMFPSRLFSVPLPGQLFPSHDVSTQFLPSRIAMLGQLLRYCHVQPDSPFPNIRPSRHGFNFFFLHVTSFLSSAGSSPLSHHGNL